MKHLIGSKPVREFSESQVDEMPRYALIEIVDENGWEAKEVFGCNEHGEPRHDWKTIDINVFRTIIKQKMTEYKEKVKAPSRYGHH